MQTIKDWRRYRIKLKDYAGQMESARVFYLDTLEELLTGIVESEDEMEALMATPGGTHWKEAHYDEKMKHRLGRSHDAYFRTLKMVIESLTQMCEKLGVSTSGQVLWDDYSIIERAMKRIKITPHKKIYKEVLDDIYKANKDTRDITHQNLYLEPVRNKRRSKRPIAEFKIIKNQAASLYQVLITGKAWKCGCKVQHLASLRLEPRTQMFEVAGANSAPAFRFRVLLCTSQEGGNPPKTPSQWQELEVVPSLDESTKYPVSFGAQDTARSIKFAPIVGKNVLEARISPEHSTNDDCDPILDICSALCTSYNLKKSLGFLVDEEDEARKHYIYRADTRIAFEPQSRSLGELLGRAGQTPSATSLSRGDRLQISVTLASSVLQLDGTSWLNSQWTSNDIYFHNKDSKADGISYSYPYLPWRLCVASGNVLPSMDLLRLEHLRDRCQVLLALGMTLVELCFGRTLSEMEKPEDRRSSIESETKDSTARRLLNAVYNEMGTSYGDVVRRCLLQPFDVREMTLDNEELQQKVFDDIVTPLAEDLKHFMGKSGSI